MVGLWLKGGFSCDGFKSLRQQVEKEVKMSAPSKAQSIQLVKVQSNERLATALVANSA